MRLFVGKTVSKGLVGGVQEGIPLPTLMGNKDPEEKISSRKGFRSGVTKTGPTKESHVRGK